MASKRRPEQAALYHAVCRVTCAGVNPVDAKFLVGDKLPSFCHGIAQSNYNGRTVGFDFAGTIDSVPKNPKFKAGDEVFGIMPPMGSKVGSFADYVEVPLAQLAHKPPALSFTEAAALPLVGITSVQALIEDNHLKSGQSLLLIGASGGVGHVALQVAKSVGARVTAVCSERNQEMVLGLGADFVVDYTKGEQALQESLQKIVREHGPFDLCFDTVSSREEKDAKYHYAQLIHSASSPNQLLKGKYVTIGGAPGDWAIAGLKRVTGLSLFPSWRELFWIRIPKSHNVLEQLAGMAAKGKLRPKIAAQVPFTDEGVRSAFAQLHSRRVPGKVVIDVQGTLPTTLRQGD